MLEGLIAEWSAVVYHDSDGQVRTSWYAVAVGDGVMRRLDAVIDAPGTVGESLLLVHEARRTLGL